jgi:hypothetical protein
MADQEEFRKTFEQLRGILRPFERRVVLVADTPESYGLDTPRSEKYGKTLQFGAARIGKSYVSFYLMPVSMFPDLLDGVSAGLKKRMQGKSCFNFKHVDTRQLRELQRLTKRCFEHFRKAGLVI